MKKFIKNNIFGFILGAIIFGSIGVVSAYTVLADNIEYTPSDSTWKKENGEDITNVKDAIDELYKRKNIENLELIADLSNSGNRSAIVSATFNDGKANQEYYVIGKYLYGGGGSTFETVNITVKSIVNAMTFNNATIIKQYPDLDMIKIKAINNGKISMSLDTGVSNGSYKARLLLRVYK